MSHFLSLLNTSSVVDADPQAMCHNDKSLISGFEVYFMPNSHLGVNAAHLLSIGEEEHIISEHNIFCLEVAEAQTLKLPIELSYTLQL